ncbi:MAG: adenylosuccinate lyase [Micrococcaceae bacterium]
MSEKHSTLAKRVDFSDIEPQIALGPLDGRYHKEVAPLVNDLSEAALNRNRLVVEIEWLIHLTEHEAVPGVKPLSSTQKEQLRAVVTSFDAEGIKAMAVHEAVTAHDVKAVEYYLKDQMAEIGIANLGELVHFGCTSEDVNNIAYALGIRDAITDVWLPTAKSLVETLIDMADTHKDSAMLSRTHGQPATPSTMGKEVAVLTYRLQRQLKRVENQEYLAKINGATGTYAAHYVACPDTNWQQISKTFVEHLALDWNPLTTQIESHDWQGELYEAIAHFNMVLHNLCTDFWTYISLGYFTQIPKKGEVGSSTMPHKINPIRFENGEANLEVSNSLLHTLTTTLATSRMQRDLTDSSIQRNVGVAIGHSLLAITNVTRGISRLAVSEQTLLADLDENWEVLAEAVQMLMRAEAVRGVKGMENPYERLKELTRGNRIDAEGMKKFVKTLELEPKAEARLAKLTPETYTGIAAKLVNHLKS